jgi:hypothetical protein
MKRIEEEVYTEIVAAIAVEKTPKRKYVRRKKLEQGRYRTVGKPKIFNVGNKQARAQIQWRSLHPDLKNNLAREIRRGFESLRNRKHIDVMVYNSMSIHDPDMLDFKISVTACVRKDYGPHYDYVSINHEDEDELLDCYYGQVLLVFKLPQLVDLGEQSWIFVKHMKTVSQKNALHPRMQRIWLKQDSDDQYGIIDAESVLDKEHIIPDFDSPLHNERFFVGRFMFF